MTSSSTTAKMASKGEFNSGNSKFFSPARTILRIKRRRDEEPIPCIRLEGLVGSNSNNISSNNKPLNRDDGDLQREGKTSLKDDRNSAHSSAVLWKRFEPTDIHGDDGPDGQRRLGGATSSSDRFRIVNAMLVDDTIDGGVGGEKHDDDDHGRRRKRRKLTLLDTSTTTGGGVTNSKTDSSLNSFHSIMASPTRSVIRSPRQPLKILDPLTRVVDDSLQEVLAGTKTVAQHYDMLRTDPRFTLQEPSLQEKWWSWSHSTGGNLLHCCALWNDSSVAHQTLQHQQRFHSQLQHRYSPTSVGPSRIGRNTGTMLSMMEAVDGDGRTPYEVAQLVGHEDVCQVLEAYGGDTTNYVYDIFYLDEAANNLELDRESILASGNGGDDYDDDNNPSTIMTAELTSGVGYWTPEGELVLEADEKCSRSLSYETDGEIDSNCEEYGGNDYPDEDDEDDDGQQEMGLGWEGQIANHAVRDDVHDPDDDCRLIQVHDHYEEYDWEQDLGEGEDHAYYDESHYYDED